MQKIMLDSLNRFWLSQGWNLSTLALPKSNGWWFYSLIYSYLIWNTKIFYVASPDITFRYLPKPVSILKGEKRGHLFNKRWSKHDKRDFIKCFQQDGNCFSHAGNMSGIELLYKCNAPLDGQTGGAKSSSQPLNLTCAWTLMKHHAKLHLM